MKKRIIGPHPTTEVSNDHWLDLEALADVEVTSEAQSHPIERAIIPREQGGWRASGPGDQTIRLLFKEPQRLTRILLISTNMKSHEHRNSSSARRPKLAHLIARLSGSNGISAHPTP